MSSRIEKPTVANTVEILAQAKNVVEDRVRIIRVAGEAGRMDEDELNACEHAYSFARAKMNGLIERMAVETVEAGKPDPTTLEKSIAQANESVQAFLGEADQGSLGARRSAEMAELVAGIIEGLGKSLVEFWSSIREGRAEKRQELAKELRRFLWLPFDQVQVNDAES